MREVSSMTPNMIWRSAFKRVGILKTCPYCKNTNTDVSVDKVGRANFKKFWLSDDFTIRTCFSCNAIWSDGVVDYLSRPTPSGDGNFVTQPKPMSDDSGRPFG